MFRFFKGLGIVIKELQKMSHESIPKSASFIESHLKEARRPFTVQRCWSCHIPKAIALGYDKRGAHILVTDRNKHLHFLTLDGHITNVLTLPATFGSVETGWRHTYGTVLLGNAGYKMYVMDCEGCILWRYPKWLGVLGGINAAHGGDINGDGNDEVLLGLNVWGGLRAFT
ncbi:MAG: hypothetical protein GY797_35865, partial [Deltaproteobacteria bacterium]|nr:hypothetical protein [Deltaproteobacteria bacterium]